MNRDYQHLPKFSSFLSFFFINKNWRKENQNLYTKKKLLAKRAMEIPNLSFLDSPLS